MGKPGRPRIYNETRIKLPYNIPLLSREKLVAIAEKLNKTQTEMLIEMIDAEHLEVVVEEKV